jgi:hypothetical protein
VEQVPRDNNDVKEIIKKSNIKDPENQELYLEASIMDSEDIRSSGTGIQQDYDELRRQIEEMKKMIQDYENQNSKLQHQMQTLSTHSALFQTKNKVLANEIIKGEKKSDTYPINFVIFLFTLGLIIGAYFNKLIS